MAVRGDDTSAASLTHRFPLLEPIEVVTAMPLGERVSPVKPLPEVAPGPAQIRRTMEDAVLSALLRPPCVVSFSGGRDSSAVLAVAVHVARREGLAPPIAMTLEFDSPKSQEHEWQQTVIRHLGIEDWRRQKLTDEMELLGETACDVVRRHGLTLNGIHHMHVPFIDAARGGSVLTGTGGDEIFRRWPWSRAEMASLVRRHRSRRVARQLMLMSLPLPLRREVLRRRRALRFPWLTDVAMSDATRRATGRAAAYVPTFQAAIDHYWGNRNTELFHGAVTALGAARDVKVVSPFATPAFLAAVRATVPPTGFRSRTDAMRDLAGDLLPSATVGRSTKATFTEIFWGARSRDFVAKWDGAGVPSDLVRVAALRDAWSEPLPSMRTWVLLQHAWLKTRSGELP